MDFSLKIGSKRQKIAILLCSIWYIGSIPFYIFLAYYVYIPMISSFPQMIFFIPPIFYISLIYPNQIRKKVLECDEYYLARVKDERIREEYYRPDTKLWLPKLTEKKGKIRNSIILCMFTIIPFAISENIFASSYILLNNSFLLIYSTIFGLITIFMIFYGVYTFFFCTTVTSMIHHFSFWKLELEENEEKNPMGELVILNSFVFICIISLFLTFYTPIILGLICFIISNINPKYDYTKNIGIEYKKYPKLIIGVLVGVNFTYLIKWWYSNFQVFAEWFWADFLFFSIGFFLILAFWKYFFDFIKGKNKNYEQDKGIMFEKISHDKFKVPLFFTISLFIFLPILFFIIDVIYLNPISQQLVRFSLFLLFTALGFITGYLAASFLFIKKHQDVLLRFKKIYFVITVIINSIIPLFYILGIFENLDLSQLILSIFIIIFCSINLYFIINFQNKGEKFIEHLIKYRYLLALSLIFVAIAPPLSYLFKFIFGSYAEILYSQFLVTMIFTGLGIIGMFLGILVLRNRTKKIVDKFIPYIPEFKREEAYFHLWESFNSNHAFYFSIFTGGTFFLLTYDSSIVIIAFNSLGFNDIFSILIWLIGNYFFLYFFGIAFGLTIWISFHATHDFWHCINISENLPEELKESHGNIKFIAGQVLILSLIIVYGAAFWWIGDLFLQATYFKLVFRFTLLAFVGISLFIGLYYLIRTEFIKKIN
ncbi:MAG: hypothetical protein EAX96_07860 [Candidatus Lokiarchaeota archaeon]|nr:hypothetical protein [Candidatus Lokiarchaeota archaeon]